MQCEVIYDAKNAGEGLTLIQPCALQKRLPHLHNVGLTSHSALREMEAQVSSFRHLNKGIWSLDFALVMLMRLVHHWIFCSG